MSILPSTTRISPGFQGAERSEVRISVYNRDVGAKAAIFRGAQNIAFDGRHEDGTPPVLQCQVQNSLGAGGQFAFALFAAEGLDPRKLIEVDAWVDISFCRFDTCWHVMRGIVDEVRVRRQVGPTGATSVTAQVTGRSFQKAFETTNSFFQQLAAANYLPAELRKVSATGLINSSPTRNVRAILFTYFKVIGSLGRANWALPKAMPGASGSLDESVRYDDDLFDPVVLARATPTGSMLFPDSNLWDIAAQQYGDGQFCELYTDILPKSGMLSFLSDSQQVNGLTPDKSTMAVIFRDKPFPRVDPKGLGLLGKASNWFRLPLWEVGREELVGSDLGTSSHEALNAFMTVGNFFSEDTAGFGALKAPLWRVADMQRRGMRKLDATSPYGPNILRGVSKFSLFQARRARLRDWYCMGPELSQGTLNLWRSYPQVRVGGRVRVRGGTPAEDFTAYVESVRHQWDARGGAKTSLDVTRGWYGTDDSLLARLIQVSSEYTLAPSRPA